MSRNTEYLNRGKRRIAGLTQLLSKRPDQFAPGVWPTYFSKAHGAEVWDLDGRKYIDMSISGIGANILGYCDPDVDAAVMQCVQEGEFNQSMQHNLYKSSGGVVWQGWDDRGCQTKRSRNYGADGRQARV